MRDGSPREGRQRRLGCVVKLGGSLAQSPHLAEWLEALAAGKGSAILVAGGGPFADAVRLAQQQRPFDNAVAHRMAILAMEQFGLMLTALCPGLKPAASRSEIAAIRRAGQVPVWLPGRMTLGRVDIAENWDVTSDSLAVWLAAVLGLTHAVLVKSATLPQEPTDAAKLARDGIVDAMLPKMLRRTGVECRCIEARQAAGFRQALRAGQPIGTRVLLDG
jgi:aspartokinase-like uncharacterized kinase